MFRLITFCISIVGFAAIVWFGVTVELGERTLFGHLRAIGNTHEAQQLWDGTKGKVTDFVGIEAARRAEAAKDALRHPAPGSTPAAPGKGALAKSDVDPEPKKAKGSGPALERAAPPVVQREMKVTPTHTQGVPVGRHVPAVAQKPK